MFKFFKRKKKNRKFAGGPLVVATHNQGKLEEFRVMFGSSTQGGRIEKLLSAGELDLPEPVEDGATFLDNAKIKALACARASGLPSMADDSGLCVNALGGNPGIYSARWAGKDKDFTKAMALVNERMGDTLDRSAYFVAVLVMAWPDGHCEWVEGRVDGTIVWPPRGQGGHGYDPFFMPDGDTRTYAEMSMAEKNKFSHRARAFEALVTKSF